MLLPRRRPAAAPPVAAAPRPPAAGGALAAGRGMLRVAWRLGHGAAVGRPDGGEGLRAAHSYAVQSLPVVLLAAAFAGAIMVLQATPWLQRFGARALVGWFAGFTALRELTPLLIGLMFNGRVGAGHCAELATWAVEGRLAALEVLGVDPYGWVLVPRAWAMVLGMAALTVVGDAVAVGAGALTARLTLGVHPWHFVRSLAAGLTVPDLLLGVGKAAAFGALLAVVATHHGLAARGGARGIGRAVHAAVVAAALGIFVLDALLDWIAGGVGAALGDGATGPR